MSKPTTSDSRTDAPEILEDQPGRPPLTEQGAASPDEVTFESPEMGVAGFLPHLDTPVEP